MASIKNRCVQVGQAVVFENAQRDFDQMARALQNDKGVLLTIKTSYFSKYDVADELRKIVKDKTEKPPVEVRGLLDPSKPMADIVSSTGSFDELKRYLDSLSDADFEPPLIPLPTISPIPALAALQTWPGRVISYDIPTKIDTDPRRTGRLIIPDSAEVFRSTEVQKWLLNNSVKYGFVIYLDKGLYYLGTNEVRNQITSAANKQEELRKIVSRHLKGALTLSSFSTTAEQVLAVTQPTVNSSSDRGNLETVIGANNILSNDRRVLDLVVVNRQPVWRPVALAFLDMKDEASRQGINLVVVSGFRPAFGPNTTARTSAGNTITIVTQESLRRDRSRWVGRTTYAGTDEDFIFRAGASQYNAATAAPGTSNHGSGIAIDLNTGSRNTPGFPALNSTIYSWLIKNSYKFGFIRTVRSEEWHFEYLPDRARNGPYASIQGTNANRFYTDLGLAQGQFPI
jgi:LAS superfamily LD-carboxypeptidase LdcB